MRKKQMEEIPYTLLKPSKTNSEKKGKGAEGPPISGHISPNFWELRLNVLVLICLFSVVEFLLKMFYLSFSLGDYLEATLRTEIYSWIAWGTNSLYHLLQLPIYFWGQSGCSLVIELKQRGTSFVPSQWPGSVSEWMLHGNGPFLSTSTGIWDRAVAPISFMNMDRDSQEQKTKLHVCHLHLRGSFICHLSSILEYN